MPNWCYNKVVCTKVFKSRENDRLFNLFVDILKEGEKSRKSKSEHEESISFYDIIPKVNEKLYDAKFDMGFGMYPTEWQCSNAGCKWDAESSVLEIEKDKVIMEFFTANTPPNIYFEVISKLFDLKITVDYEIELVFNGKGKAVVLPNVTYVVEGDN